MKNIRTISFFFLVAVLQFGNAIAQIYTPAGVVAAVTNGTNNVGIGTTTPNNSLVVYKETGADLAIITNQSTSESSLWFRINSVAKDGGILYRNDGRLSFNLDNEGGAFVENNEFMTILPNGNVGIGKIAPASKLDVNGGITVQSNNNIQWGGSYGPGIPTISGSINSGLYFYPTGSTSGIAMRIHPSGFVGIGTQQPDARLTVKGIIHSEEVRVDLNVPAPDYVFDGDYNLMPLDELEAYIIEKRHLPEVRTADEMKTNGLNLKEMNLILLKKVEELTLHIIEINKKVETLEKGNAIQENELERLQKRNRSETN